MKIIYYRHNPTFPCEIQENLINFNELTFVLSGETMYYVNGEKQHLKQGNAIFIQSGSIRKRNPLGACDYVSFNFTDYDNLHLPRLIENATTTEIKHLIATCDEIYKNHYQWTDKVEQALSLIIYLIKSRLEIQKENPLVIKIKRFVKENINNKINLNDIANHVNYSPNYCEAVFKQETGTSVIDYLIKERINEASMLIDEGLLSLTTIAEIVGFQDYNYFSRCFKKNTNYSPTQYKRRFSKK